MSLELKKVVPFKFMTKVVVDKYLKIRSTIANRKTPSKLNKKMKPAVWAIFFAKAGKAVDSIRF